jgi:excisionase family DNA binding protein
VQKLAWQERKRMKEATKEATKEVTPAEAARRLGFALSYIYSLVWSAKLPARKLAGRWRIPVVAIEQIEKQREARSGTPGS